MRLNNSNSCCQSKRGQRDENVEFLVVSRINDGRLIVGQKCEHFLSPSQIFHVSLQVRFHCYTLLHFVLNSFFSLISGICTQVDGNITVLSTKEEEDISESGQINPKLSDCQDALRNK